MPPHTYTATLTRACARSLAQNKTHNKGRIVKEVELTLAGKFNEIIGEGDQNKRKFLYICTHKISLNHTRNVECTGARPGSIIVGIGGEPETLVDLVHELKAERFFKLDGYSAISIENVEVIFLPMTEAPGDIWSAIISFLMDNGS